MTGTTDQNRVGQSIAPSHVPAHGGGEPIHFARASRRQGDAFQHIRLTCIFSGIGVMGILSVAILVIVSVLGSISAIPLTLVGLLGVVLGVRWWVLWRRRQARYASDGSCLDSEPQENHRVCCVGLPDELEPYGPLEDLPFEPAIFHAALAFQPSGWAIGLVWVFAAIGGMGAWYLVHRVWGVPNTGGTFYFWGAYGLGIVALTWLRPIYFRVVPGRLDVLRYSALRTQPLRVDHYNLSTASVLIDLRRWLLFVDRDDQSAEFSFMLVPGRRRFAHTILRAAISTHQPAPLPDGELLG